MDIRVVDNTPEELRDLVIEMIDRLEGRHVEPPQEQCRHPLRKPQNATSSIRSRSPAHS
jgi:hypothetical protein